MPNWNQNSLQVSGLTPNQTTLMKEALEGEEFLETFIPSPDWKNIPNEEGVLPEERTHTHTNRLGETELLATAVCLLQVSAVSVPRRGGLERILVFEHISVGEARALARGCQL